jgi:very-short-patch-repair endonuclease
MAKAPVPLWPPKLRLGVRLRSEGGCVAIVLHFVSLDPANPGATHAALLNDLENEEKAISHMKTNMNLGAGRLIFDHAFDLRKHPTPAEARLWHFLRNRQVAGVKFRRQHAIRKFILDFYAHEVKLAVEIDGTHHQDDRSQVFYDADRSDILTSYGITILRFSNGEVMNDTGSVVTRIRDTIAELRK